MGKVSIVSRGGSDKCGKPLNSSTTLVGEPRRYKSNEGI